MTIRYTLHARITQAAPIAEFELAEGEELDTRVIREISKAIEERRLDGLALRVGLPPIMVSGVDDGESLSGGPNVVVQQLFAADGEPLAERDYRTNALGNGGVALFGTVEGRKDVPLGVLASQALADLVGSFWKNGHIVPEDGAPAA